MMTPRNEPVKKAFEFLRTKALSQESFTVGDIETATGWATQSVTTYISKQWQGYLVQSGRGETKTYTGRRQFLRVTEQEFLEVATQKR